MGVASASILASVHNTMNERRREFAILRALGARRRTLLAAVVTEAAAIAAAGALAGLGVYAIILEVAATVVREQTGVVLSPWEYAPALWAVPLAMVLLGAMAGLLPALRAYATDVAAHLGPVS
jgi:putative ABC transport system permease protein